MRRAFSLHNRQNVIVSDIGDGHCDFSRRKLDMLLTEYHLLDCRLDLLTACRQSIRVADFYLRYLHAPNPRICCV